MPRCYNHDYRSRCIYHITLRKDPAVPFFGRLCGECPNLGIARSPSGAVIESNTRRFPAFHSALRVLQYSIMPDHLHLLLFVTAPVPYQLGNYIGMFKTAVHCGFRTATGHDTPPFERDFYDCILYRDRPLDTLYRYLRDNPRRLAERRRNPDFFRRINSLTINDRYYQAYGNLQLLRNPFKEQVVVHRADTAGQHGRNRRRWLHTGANGGVLVSPFISTSEKAVRAEAEAAGARFILITTDPFGERYKPGAHDFDLCAAGRMLIISINQSGDLSRATCIAMNELAGAIAEI